jgi:5'-nucleotidase
MEDKSKAYQIFKKDGIKIGVYGLGIKLTGLVNPQQYGNTKYLDPIAKAIELERFLKLDQKCDLVICLSHLGYKYRDNTISDLVLAQNTYHTDLIIGGHTHTFLNTPDIIKNKSGKETLVNQVGFAGINLGRIDFTFMNSKNKKVTHSTAIEVIDKKFKF